MSRYLTSRALCHPALPISRKAQRRALPRIELSDEQQALYERLGSDADVRLEPGINQDEIFDDQFERRAHEMQRTPLASSGISIVPARTGPWTSNGNLGIERSFSADENNRQTILKMPEWDFPGLWQVTLGMTFNREGLGAASALGFSVRAIIEAGAGGAIQDIECDWMNGVSIPIPFNAINVVAEYDNVDVIPDDLRLRVTLARRGSGSSFMKPQLTRIFTVGANPDVSDRVEIPAFATSFRVIPSGTPAISAQIWDAANGFQFHATDNTTISACVNAAQALTYMGSDSGIPIPNNMRFVSYNNGGVALGLSGHLLFNLSV